MVNPNPSLRVMVDANVIIAGLGWPRWPYAILQHAIAGDFQLVLSEYVVEEARFHIKRLVPAALPHFETFLELSSYESIETPPIAEEHHRLSRDAKDVPVALAAVVSKVDCLVSTDKDLTESEALKRHVPVVLPAVFLRDYLGWTSEQLEAIRHRTWSDFSPDA